jgi:hypothetical protein
MDLLPRPPLDHIAYGGIDGIDLVVGAARLSREMVRHGGSSPSTTSEPLTTNERTEAQRRDG